MFLLDIITTTHSSRSTHHLPIHTTWLIFGSLHSPSHANEFPCAWSPSSLYTLHTYQTHLHTHHIRLKPDTILTTFLHAYRTYTLPPTIPDVYASLQTPPSHPRIKRESGEPSKSRKLPLQTTPKPTPTRTPVTLWRRSREMRDQHLRSSPMLEGDLQAGAIARYSLLWLLLWTTTMGLFGAAAGGEARSGDREALGGAVQRWVSEMGEDDVVGHGGAGLDRGWYLGVLIATMALSFAWMFGDAKPSGRELLIGVLVPKLS